MHEHGDSLNWLSYHLYEHHLNSVPISTKIGPKSKRGKVKTHIGLTEQFELDIINASWVAKWISCVVQVSVEWSIGWGSNLLNWLVEDESMSLWLGCSQPLDTDSNWFNHTHCKGTTNQVQELKESLEEVRAWPRWNPYFAHLRDLGPLKCRVFTIHT